MADEGRTRLLGGFYDGLGREDFLPQCPQEGVGERDDGRYGPGLRIGMGYTTTRGGGAARSLTDESEEYERKPFFKRERSFNYGDDEDSRSSSWSSESSFSSYSCKLEPDPGRRYPDFGRSPSNADHEQKPAGSQSQSYNFSEYYAQRSRMPPPSELRSGWVTEVHKNEFGLIDNSIFFLQSVVNFNDGFRSEVKVGDRVLFYVETVSSGFPFPQKATKVQVVSTGVFDGNRSLPRSPCPSEPLGFVVTEDRKASFHNTNTMNNNSRPTTPINKLRRINMFELEFDLHNSWDSVPEPVSPVPNLRFSDYEPDLSRLRSSDAGRRPRSPVSRLPLSPDRGQSCAYCSRKGHVGLCDRPRYRRKKNKRRTSSATNFSRRPRSFWKPPCWMTLMRKKYRGKRGMRRSAFHQ